jgi:hypothetical protein
MVSKNAKWDEYHALLGKVSRMEDSLNIPRESRVMPVFQEEINEPEQNDEVPQYGLAVRILLWIKGIFREK